MFKWNKLYSLKGRWIFLIPTNVEINIVLGNFYWMSWNVFFIFFLWRSCNCAIITINSMARILQIFLILPKLTLKECGVLKYMKTMKTYYNKVQNLNETRLKIYRYNKIYSDTLFTSCHVGNLFFPFLHLPSCYIDIYIYIAI